MLWLAFLCAAACSDGEQESHSPGALGDLERGRNLHDGGKALIWNVSGNTWGIVAQIGGALDATANALWSNCSPNTTGELALTLLKPPARSQS